MRNARIWVLIADVESARICSSTDGMTKLIPMLSLGNPLGEADARRSVEAFRAWYSPEKRNFFFTRTVKQQYAAHIAQILLEAAREDTYDGLMIVATPEIESDLTLALAPEVRALLIGDVIRDLPYASQGEPPVLNAIRH